MAAVIVGPLPAELALATRDELRAKSVVARAAITNAYWAFSRQARGPLVPPHLYTREVWVEEALRRARSAA